MKCRVGKKMGSGRVQGSGRKVGEKKLTANVKKGEESKEPKRRQRSWVIDRVNG